MSASLGPEGPGCIHDPSSSCRYDLGSHGPREIHDHAVSRAPLDLEAIEGRLACGLAPAPACDLIAEVRMLRADLLEAHIETQRAHRVRQMTNMRLVAQETKSRRSHAAIESAMESAMFWAGEPQGYVVPVSAIRSVLSPPPEPTPERAREITEMPSRPLVMPPGDGVL